MAGPRVIAEKMKIYSFIHVGKFHIHGMFPRVWINSKFLYSTIYLISLPQNWRGVWWLNVTVSQSAPVLTLVLTHNFFLMFLYITDGQQSNLVCCHNDALAFSSSRLPNYFKCLWNCECYVLCCASSCLFTYFGFFGSHYNSSVGSVKSRLQNVKWQYLNAYWKVPTQGLLELGAIFLTCWSNSNFCSMNSTLKELYHISEAPVAVLKFELWFTVGDLNSPREQWFSFH